MRAAIFVILVAVLALAAALATGLLRVRAGTVAQAPDLKSRHTVAGSAAQGPGFDVEAGSVRAGSKTAKPKAPAVEVGPPPANHS